MYRPAGPGRRWAQPGKMMHTSKKFTSDTSLAGCRLQNVHRTTKFPDAIPRIAAISPIPKPMAT